MRMLKMAATLLTLAVSVSTYTAPSHAQSFLERFAVPKSKLVNRIWTQNDPNSSIVVDHGRWDAFLSKYVRTDGSGVNRVAYGRVSGADKSTLNAYLADLQKVDVTKLNRNEQYAFWLNLYNASTVSVAINNYPIKSIRDVKNSAVDFVGPFNDKIATVNGKSLTLNAIESGIVRPIWKDPRLHYAFNCAAVTCPNLGKKAYVGSKINGQLNAAARAYVNDPRGVTVKNGKITASKIYFWYEDDFGGSEASILNHIRRYANNSLKSKLANAKGIDDYVYDWALNDR
ncbi:MAG: DUF547 domain-containing protein [Pseudomonadota bacterium]